MTNPFLLKNMSKAVDRLLLAKKRGEKIAVWGDYDGDGIPGVVLLYEGLQQAGFNLKQIVVALPDTLKSGHGFNTLQMEKLRVDGVKLILTVDFGISEVAGVAFAQKLGMDVIVLDHHLPQKKLPKAILVNPKQKGDRYPFKGFSGAGVAYKFIEAVFRKLKIKPAGLKKFHDLVALAAVFDRMPLESENAALIKSGFSLINKKPRLGLKMLKKILRINQINRDNIWEIIERLASGATEGVHERNNLFRFFTTTDRRLAKKIVLRMDQVTRLFRRTVNNVFFAILKKLRTTPPKKVIIERCDTALSGVLGEVASKLYAVFNLPVFLYSLKENGKSFKGSSRAPKGYDLVGALNNCTKLFTKYGGHKQAAGYDFPKSKEKQFVRCIKKYYDQ